MPKHVSPSDRTAHILDFWIGDAWDTIAAAKEKGSLWFRKSLETDAQISTLFLEDLASIASGEWRSFEAVGPKGLLASIIVLDQFSRNIFRGMPGAFENDALALKLTLRGLSQGMHHDFSEVEVQFMLMPLMHAEDEDIQADSVACFEKLADGAREQFSDEMASVLDFAVRHKKIIDRFGRYPHRNATLGRASTSDEIAFLKEPGSSF